MLEINNFWPSLCIPAYKSTTIQAKHMDETKGKTPLPRNCGGFSEQTLTCYREVIWGGFQLVDISWFSFVAWTYHRSSGENTSPSSSWCILLMREIQKKTAELYSIEYQSEATLTERFHNAFPSGFILKKCWQQFCLYCGLMINDKLRRPFSFCCNSQRCKPLPSN